MGETGGCSGRWRPRRGGGRSASGARAQPRRDGSGQGNPSSPPQAFDPRVAGFGDPDLEAVEAGLELAVRRDPDDEGIDQEGAAGAGRLLRHRADGLLGDPEPDLVARRGRARPRTRRSRSVPGWARARSGFSPRRGQSSRVPSMTIASSPTGPNGGRRRPRSSPIRAPGTWLGRVPVDVTPLIRPRTSPQQRPDRQAGRCGRAEPAASRRSCTPCQALRRASGCHDPARWTRRQARQPLREVLQPRRRRHRAPAGDYWPAPSEIPSFYHVNQ